MPKPVERPIMVTPFIVAQQNANTDGNTRPLKKPGAHLGKEEATREVLKRVVNRVKRI
jgi:hypothetical protein